MAKPKTLPYEAAEQPEAYSVTLHNTSGGADKIYKLAIEPREGGFWAVNYENGRRGGTMANGTKTKSLVGYTEARKICNSQLFDKVGGGYVPIAGSRFGDGMTAEAIATIARESSGYIPQLLLAVEEDDLERLIEDDSYVAQPKMDGERRFLIVEGGAVSGGNRKGQTVAISGPVAQSASAIARDVVLDGEQIGDVYWYWDMLALDGKSLNGMSFDDRMDAISAAGLAHGPAVRQVPTAYGADAKRQLLEEVRASGGEGIVFKHRDAAYEPGKPGSKATWRKFKFWQSLSAVVGRVNAQRSVGLDLIDEDGSRFSVGNVTIPANNEVPAEGDVVEVSYLYAYDGGSLFQPTYLGRRNDIDLSECLASQRVFKVEADEDNTAGLKM